MVYKLSANNRFSDEPLTRPLLEGGDCSFSSDDLDFCELVDGDTDRGWFRGRERERG